MEDIETERFIAVIRGDLLFISLKGRPGDWRSKPIGALDSWLARQWRDMSMDAPVTGPGELDEAASV